MRNDEFPIQGSDSAQDAADVQDERLREVLKEAYPAAEPSDDLQRRVAEMAARHLERTRPRAAWWRPMRFGWAAMFLIVLVGALAFQYLLRRPGEQAIQLIPADALLVVTLDTNPSPEQVPLFLRIDQALKREGMAAKVDEAMARLVEKSSISAEMRPYVTTNFALALIDTANKRKIDDATPVLFLELKDADKALDVLKRYGRPARIGGLSAYRLPKDQYSATIVASYLVLTPAPELLARVESAYEQQIPVVAGLREYQEARAALPKDANMMVFLSPTAMAMADETTKTVGIQPFRDLRWMALSATLRDQGIKFDFRLPIPDDGKTDVRRLAQIAPLDPGLLKRLPPGAYGLCSLSQPGRYWDVLVNAVSEDAKEKADFMKGVADFEKETGLSVQGDLEPGLNGQSVLAVYPDQTKPDSEVDVLAVLDDSHGADPTVFAAKLRAYIERTSRTGRQKGAQFIQTTRYGVPVWYLDKAGERAAENGLSRRIEGASEDHVHAGSDGASKDTSKGTLSNTMAFAQVGKTVFIATSLPMLDRGIAAWIAPGYSLADDRAYLGMQQQVTPDAQGLLMVNLSAIVQRLRANVKEGTKKDSASALSENLLHLFGDGSSGLVLSAKFDGKFETGSFFLPLDYERAVHVLSDTSKEVGSLFDSDGDDKDKSDD